MQGSWAIGQLYMQRQRCTCYNASMGWQPMMLLTLLMLRLLLQTVATLRCYLCVSVRWPRKLLRGELS